MTEKEVPQFQKFTRLVGGSFLPAGFYALGDYGRILIPWESIGHLLAVIIEKARKGASSPHLIFLPRTMEAIYYFDGHSADYEESLAREATDNHDYNLKLFIRKTVPYLTECVLDPALFHFIKGGSHFLRRFSNLKALVEYCGEVSAGKTDESSFMDPETDETAWGSLVRQKHSFFLERRQAAALICERGLMLASGSPEEPDELPARDLPFAHTLRNPGDCFSTAQMIDPYCHFPYACMAFQALKDTDIPEAISRFETAVSLVPYPMGIEERQAALYSELIRGFLPHCSSHEMLFPLIEHFLGFSPRPQFRESLVLAYRSLKVYSAWYDHYLAAVRDISHKKFGESLQPLEKVMELYPAYLWAHHWQGVALARMGRPVEARRSFEKVAKSLYSSHTYIELYMLLKDRSDTQLLYYAREANPLSCWPYYFLGMAARQFEKDFPKACFLLCKSLLIDPKGPFAGKIMEEAHQAAPPAGKVPASTRKELERGDLLGGKYHITQIFKGGMGIVYLAYDAMKDAHYAVKTFQERFLWDKSIVEMFLKEAQTWIQLDIHQNVVKALFAETFDGKPYLFLECIRGTDLQKVLEKGPLTVPDALEYAIQATGGLHYAYAKLGIVHRDIKPSNCLISEENILKITDFGLAKIFDSRMEEERKASGGRLEGDLMLSSNSTFMGTIPYMPPERLLYMEPGDIRSDVYSFGVMLYQMLTGSLPFEAEKLMENLSIVITEPVVPPHEIDPQIPHEVSFLVLTCLQPDPARRFTSFEEVKKALIPPYEKYTSRQFSESTPMKALSYRDMVKKGLSLLEIGRFREALESFSQAMQLDPRAPEAISGRGSALMKMGNYRKALQCFEEVLQATPHDVEVLKNKGTALLELGELREALENFKTIITLAPRDSYSLWKIGSIYGRIGNPGDAITFIDKALSLDGKMADALIEKGSYLLQTGRSLEATACFDQVLALNPTSQRCLFYKAEALMKNQQYEETLTTYRLILALEGTNTEALWGAALCLEKLGRAEESMRYLDKILMLKPDESKALAHKGRILRARGLREEALECYRTTPCEELKDCAILIEKGIIEQELFLLQEARLSFERVIELDPRNREARAHLNEIGVQSGIGGLYWNLYESTFRNLTRGELHARAVESAGKGNHREALVQLSLLTESGRATDETILMKARFLGSLGRFSEGLLALEEDMPGSFPPESAKAEREKLVNSYQNKKKSKAGLLGKLFSATDHDPLALFRKAKGLIQEGALKDAQKFLEDTVRDDPENSRYWYHLGLFYGMSGVLPMACESLKKALAIDGSVALYWSSKGDFEKAMGELNEARESYEKSIETNPLHYNGWAGMISLYEDRGFVKKARAFALKALAILSDALEINKDIMDFLPKKAFLELFLGRRRASLATSERFLALQPDNPEALKAKGLAFLTGGAYSEALTLLKTIPVGTPEYWPSMFHIGYALERLGAHDEAIAAYDLILGGHPLHEWTLFRKSMALEGKAMTEEALLCIDGILEHNPDSALAMKAKAYLLYRQKKYAEALWCFQKPLEHIHDDYICLFNSAVLALSLGLADDAARAAGMLLQIDAYDHLLWVLYGDALLLGGKREDALKAYDHAIEIDPLKADGYLHQSNLFYREGEFHKALLIIEEALEVHPTMPSLLNNAACIYAGINRPGEAREAIKKAILYSPGSETFLFNSGLLFMRDGEFLEAKKAFDSALYLAPSFIDAYAARGLSDEFTGHLKEAVSFYDQALKRDTRSGLLWFLRGKAYFLLNLFDEAIRSYSQAIKLQPEMEEAWLHKAMALMRLQRSGEAHQSFEHYKTLPSHGEKHASMEALGDLPPSPAGLPFQLKVMETGIPLLGEPVKLLLREGDFYR
ncbi:MAG: tetratricopeptide repeat protein [Candidatus Eremiobacteraeota bacterium]|nr:tetratricopeptide repeat protein [Candidatus Eremiobacteraeota bacterium]